jgi:hypothetical protein
LVKKVGYSSEHIVKKAGEEGTQVHEMIEDYLNGKELNFLTRSETHNTTQMYGRCSFVL